MNQIRLMLLTVAVVFASSSTLLAKDYVVDSDSYAAIAYSTSTGQFGYAYNYPSRWDAERAAVRNCEAADAKVACSVRAGYCALALGDDRDCWGYGYSYGNGATNLEAINHALKECGKRTKNPYIAVLLLSDGQVVFTRKRKSN